jgi:hypothetical protein
MTPPSDKVRPLAPTWSKLAYEAHPAFGVGGWEEAPRRKNWALEVCCVDQCNGEVGYEDVPSGCCVDHRRQRWRTDERCCPSPLLDVLALDVGKDHVQRSSKKFACCLDAHSCGIEKVG